MLRKIFVLVVLILISYLICHGYEFKWNLNTNEIIRIKSFVKQNIYTNNAFVKYVELLNKATIDVKNISYQGGKKLYGIEGIYYVFSKEYLRDLEFKLDETFLSKYLLEENGKMYISREYLMPVARDIPVFPKDNLELGKEWTYTGKEVHKLGSPNLFDIVEVDFKVYYKFKDITNINNKNIGLFEIKYGFSTIFTKTIIVQYLSGSSEMLYYWDIDEGKPYYMTENYFFNAIYKNGLSVIYSGTSESTLEVIKKWEEKDKKEIISKLQEVIEKNKVVEITTDENEINISIPDIMFDFNSYKVKDNFVSILSNLANRIKDLNEIDIVVEGHTDDIGNEEYNQKLSENRAKEVVNILIKHGIDPNRISYIGYGKRKPKVPNTSEENRAKNRRVEIKLIWGK